MAIVVKVTPAKKKVTKKIGYCLSKYERWSIDSVLPRSKKIDFYKGLFLPPIKSWKTHCVKRIDWMTRCEIVWWRDVLFHLIRRNMVRRIGQGPATDGAQPGEPDNRPDFSLPFLYIIVGPSVYYSCSPQITNGINTDIVHLPCKLVVQLVMQTPRLAATTSTLYSSKSSSLASRCIRYGFCPVH